MCKGQASYLVCFMSEGFIILNPSAKLSIRVGSTLEMKTYRHICINVYVLCTASKFNMSWIQLQFEIVLR